MYRRFEVFGTVCEFNPLHKGHIKLFNTAREMGATHIVVVMSGNYVQRGEAACFDKWSRTRAALRAGADMVIELPLPWAMSSTEKFAFGGVSLLNSINCVDKIIFGTECGDIEKMKAISAVMNSPQFSDAIKSSFADNQNNSFASVNQKAVSELFGREYGDILASPNNSLAIGYLRALDKLDSQIVPVTTLRSNMNKKEPSATYVRSLLRKNINIKLDEFTTESIAEIFSKAISDGIAPVFTENLQLPILSKLRNMKKEDFLSLPDISEGIENRLMHAIREAVSLDTLHDSIKSKRYTHARVRRLVMNSFLGVTSQHGEGEPPYCRVLGMNIRGKELLPAISKSSLPLIMRHSDSCGLNDSANEIYELECRADDQYELGKMNIQPCGADMRNGIIVEKMA